MTDLDHEAHELRFTHEQIERATAETERLQRELNIANADHIALWLEANLPDASIGWLACRIVEAHEQVMALALKEADSKNEAQLHEWNNAEARATAAEAKVAALTEAVEPFAGVADSYEDCEQHPGGCPDDAPAGETIGLTVGDFRRARTALASIEGGVA